MDRLRDYGLQAAMALLVLLLLVGVVVFVSVQRQARPLEIASSDPAPEVRSRALKVYITGEVARPGVYPLVEGDRIEDAIAAAGGATANADLVRVNLAARVRDQLQINVPGHAIGPEGIAPGAPTTLSTKLNLNTAGIAELDVLPGVGPVTAGRIVAYRQEKGLFKAIEDLKEAKLVNNSTFEKIKDLIEVR